MKINSRVNVANSPQESSSSESASSSASATLLSSGSTRGSKSFAATMGSRVKSDDHKIELKDEKMGLPDNKLGRTGHVGFKAAWEKIAADVNSGLLTQEEATHLFVSSVVRERMGVKGSESALRELENSIGEILDNDPNFTNKLSSQLHGLSNVGKNTR